MITEIPIKTELSTAYGGGNFRLETSFRDPGGNDGSRRPLNNEISEMSGGVLDGSGRRSALVLEWGGGAGYRAPGPPRRYSPV
jgi:hypothetical protein